MLCFDGSSCVGSTAGRDCPPGAGVKQLAAQLA